MYTTIEKVGVVWLTIEAIVVSIEGITIYVTVFVYILRSMMKNYNKTIMYVGVTLCLCYTVVCYAILYYTVICYAILYYTVVCYAYATLH